MSNLSTFDVTKLDASDIVQCLVNLHYEVAPRDVKFAKDHDLCKFSHCDRGNAYFIVVFRGDDGEFIASDITVNFGSSGKLVAEFGGCPRFETTDEDEMLEWWDELLKQY